MKSGKFALTKDALYSIIYNRKLVKCSALTSSLKAYKVVALVQLN